MAGAAERLLNVVRTAWLNVITWIFVGVAALAWFNVFVPDRESILFRVTYAIVLVGTVLAVTSKFRAPLMLRWLAPVALVASIWKHQSSASTELPSEEIALVPACARTWHTDEPYWPEHSFPPGTFHAATEIDQSVAFVMGVAAAVIRDSLRAKGVAPDDLASAVAVSPHLSARSREAVARAASFLRWAVSEDGDSLTLLLCGVDEKCGTCDDILGEFEMVDSLIP